MQNSLAIIFGSPVDRLYFIPQSEKNSNKIQMIFSLQTSEWP
jgi:hypothetical protein